MKRQMAYNKRLIKTNYFCRYVRYSRSQGH